MARHNTPARHTTLAGRTAVANRIALGLTGLALTAGGGAALARGLDADNSLMGASNAPVLDRPTRDFAADHAWFWPVLATAAAIIALLCLWWLAAQTRTDAVRTLRFEPDPRDGSTTLPTRALLTALRDDLTDSPYLRRASAALTGDTADPHLNLTVTLEAGADPAAAKQRVRQSLDRLAEALETPTLTAVVQIRTSRS